MKGIGIARIGLVAASLTATALTTDARAQEGELVKNFLSGIGILPEEKEPIRYNERPPLVLPPRMELREPAQPGSAQARSGQWPNDPDVVERRRRDAEARTPITENERYRMMNGDARLSVEEMRAGRRAGAQVPTGPVTRSDNAHWIHPDVLRAQENKLSASQVAGAGESTGRRSLTEPPSAYRQSATGKPIRGSFEAQTREDEGDPRFFQRQMQQRRNQ